MGNHFKLGYRSRCGGFSRIQLIVTLAIVGVLASLITQYVLERKYESQKTEVRFDINELTQALKLYRTDNQRFPTSAQGLQALVKKPTNPPIPDRWRSYFEKLPNDPWGHPYQYLNPGVRNEVDILSFGADGQLGGDGKDVDIGSWQ